MFSPNIKFAPGPCQRRFGKRLGTRLALSLLLTCGVVCAASPSAYRLQLSFIDDHGASRALSEWTNKAVVVAMAYGACRNICSTTLRTLEEVQSRADQANVEVEFVVVSFDPVEDTPQVWADYRKSRRLRRRNWTFLSGSKDATRTLARFMGIKFWSYDDHVIHDLKILRLNPDGTIAAVLDWNHRDIEALF